MGTDSAFTLAPRKTTETVLSIGGMMLISCLCRESSQYRIVWATAVTVANFLHRLVSIYRRGVVGVQLPI
jgi:hypothetical protein